MSLVDDIAQAYLAPRKAMQTQMDRGITEPQTLFYGILFGAVNLVANYPRVAQSASDPDTIAGMMGGLFIAYIFFLPLMLYGIAGIAHWVAVKFGGQGTWNQARRAMNWSALVCIPFILISGASNVFENSTIPMVLNALTGAVFIWQLWENFREVELL